MRLIERTRRALDGAAKPFGYRVCYAADTDRALDIVPARDILKCEGCGEEFHRDWADDRFGNICPNCSGAS